jgi:subtilisin family serine protease
MRKVAAANRMLMTLALATMSLVTLWTTVRSQPLSGSDDTSIKLLIVFKPTEYTAALAAAAQTLLSQYKTEGLLRLDPLGIDGARSGAAAYLGIAAAKTDVKRLIDALAHSPLVLSVEPDAPRHFAFVDPITGTLDADFIYQHYYFDIGAVTMWAKGLTGISVTNPITVAVIDTGVELSHPDINNNLVPGFDFALNVTPTDESLYSHGSMVAGVIAAEINNDIVGGQARGVAGIGGGDAQSGTLGLRVMPLRVALDAAVDFDCATSAQAIDYARTQGAKVINLSYAGPDPCAVELAAIQRAYDAGLALVAGAGNGATSTPMYPAAYGTGTNDRLVIAVAGLKDDGTKAPDSNYGTWIDISAPFTVYSLVRGGTYGPGSGTSFSTPFVSGLIGVLMSNYGWSRDKAISIMLAAADNMDAFNPGYHGLLGTGRINAARASTFIHDVDMPLVVK